MSGQLNDPTAFLPPSPSPGTDSSCYWVGLTVGMDGFGEERISCLCRDSNPVASRYTDYAIPAPLSVSIVCKFVTKI